MFYIASGVCDSPCIRTYTLLWPDRGTEGGTKGGLTVGCNTMGLQKKTFLSPTPLCLALVKMSALHELILYYSELGINRKI